MTESDKTIEFNKTNFIKQFSGSLSQMDSAFEMGSNIGGGNIDQVYFIGCGAPHHLFLVLEYWGAKYATHTTFHRYFPAEFILHNPQSIDEHSLIVFGSHSGTTKETVDAAAFAKTTPAKTLAFTQSVDSPLGKIVDIAITYGETKEGYFSAFMLTLAFLSAFLSKKEPDWPYHEALVQSLPHLPSALADAKKQTLQTAMEQAALMKDIQQLYVLGAGPMYTTAYVFASCFLMEMQWLHAYALQAAEFFHGPFEVVEPSTPILLLIGEGPTRPIAERVKRFTKQFSENTLIYDAKEFNMPGILPEIRPLVAPMIVDAALTNLVESIAILRKHPMSTRRYMGKVEY